jgi:2-keto-4-pentenoate hydratase/2-oxohepta-3-ene-1,7-dioic acid hydratase in catechol pathway
MLQSFDRLIRFKDQNGKIRYGEAPDHRDLIGKRVLVYNGTLPWDLSETGQEAEVVEILCPLPQVPIFYGIGLNYKQHIKEAGFPTPKYPLIFTKPPDACAGPYEDIPFDAQCVNMDYEGELCFVLGKDCKNFTKENDPTEYILGFTVGNDVSSRFWQMPEQSGQQHGYAKSFDKFAPIGPIIVSPVAPAIRGKLHHGTPHLTLRTLVNGEERQRTQTSDLLFDIATILEHLSRGTVIRRGTVVLTGTPSGVAAFLEPPNWLRHGDVVEIDIEGLGVIRNKMVCK